MTWHGKEKNGMVRCYKEKLSMAKGKPQQIGMTVEINSIPTYPI
jgi:hypothetical protein